MEGLRHIAFLACLIICNTSSANTAQQDSLSQLFNASKSDSVKVTLLILLSKSQANIDSAQELTYALEAVNLAKSTKNKRWLNDAYVHLAEVYQSHNIIEKEMMIREKALSLSRELKDPQLVSMHLNAIGFRHYNFGNNAKALSYYLESMKLCEQTKNKWICAAPLIKIGMIYYHQKDFLNALEYYQKSYEIYRELKSIAGIRATLIWIGIIQYELKDYEKSLETYFKVLEFCDPSENINEISMCYNNIGLVYIEQQEYTQALEYMKKSLDINKTIGSQLGVSNCFINFCDIYFQMGDYEKAIEYCDEAARFYLQHDEKNRLEEIYRLLSNIYERKGQFKKAFDYYKMLTEVRDTLYNEEKSKELGKFEAKYEMEKRLAEEKRQEEERSRVAEQVRARRDNLQYSGILIFVLMLFAVVFISGKFSISERIAEGLIFFTFLLFFEFTLVLLDPYIEQYSSGAPAIKLGFNAVLAGLIFPMHSFFEKKLKSRIVN